MEIIFFIIVIILILLFVFIYDKVTAKNKTDKNLSKVSDAQEITLYTCSNCAGEVARKASICPHCRALLRGVECTSCREIYSQDLPGCPKCGFINTHYVPKLMNCCLCHKDLVGRGRGDIDDVARFCMNCGADVCVFCLQTLGDCGNKKCPVCNQVVIFELRPH
jgi:hypothetical protein